MKAMGTNTSPKFSCLCMCSYYLLGARLACALKYTLAVL